MLYDRYLASTGGEQLDVNDELNRAKRLFEAVYAPYLPRGVGSRILDIGCGFGKILWAAREFGYRNIEGVDVSDDQVAFGKSELSLPLEKGDGAEKLLSLTGELDAILAIDVLEHCDLEYSISLLQAARTALKADGVLIAQVPNGLSPLCPTFHGDITHVRAFSVSSLAQLFRFGGFETFEFRSLPPVVHGVPSAIRSILWAGVLRPLLGAYFLISCGSAQGGIYTPNLLGVARNGA